MSKYKYRIIKKASESSFTVERSRKGFLRYFDDWHFQWTMDTLTEAIDYCLKRIKRNEEEERIEKERPEVYWASEKNVP